MLYKYILNNIRVGDSCRQSSEENSRAVGDLESKKKSSLWSQPLRSQKQHTDPQDARQKRNTASGTVQNRAEMKERRDGVGMGKKREKLWKDAAMLTRTRSTKVDAGREKNTN